MITTLVALLLAGVLAVALEALKGMVARLQALEDRTQAAAVLALGQAVGWVLQRLGLPLPAGVHATLAGVVNGLLVAVGAMGAHALLRALGLLRLGEPPALKVVAGGGGGGGGGT